MQNGAAQIDKHDAERLNLLKIDALGLRTLSILQDVLDQVGWEREKLINWKLDDDDAFKVLNDENMHGYFSLRDMHFNLLQGK